MAGATMAAQAAQAPWPAPLEELGKTFKVRGGSNVGAEYFIHVLLGTQAACDLVRHTQVKRPGTDQAVCRTTDAGHSRSTISPR